MHFYQAPGVELKATRKPSEEILSRTDVSKILAKENETCRFSQIGYYDSIESIAKRTSDSKYWEYGEIFVYARSTECFLILKQIAPDSCEMLIISNNGSHDVVTACALPLDVFVDQLRGYVCMNETVNG